MPKTNTTGSTKKAKKTPKAQPVIIGIDTEYEQDPTNPARNIVLSYQWCVVGPDGTRVTGIRHVYDGQRISFPHLVSDAIQDALNQKVLRTWPENLWVCAHYSAAEISMFSDRTNLSRKLSILRGTFVSLGAPLVLSHNVNGHKRTFRIRFIDTKLLSPAKKQSLADLGEAVGLSKISIAKTDIAAMGVFRQRDIAAFEAYAKRDAEVTALYVLKLMEYARQHNLLDGEKPPVTIGSMAVQAVIRSLTGQGIDTEDFLGASKRAVTQWIASDPNAKHRKIITKQMKVKYPGIETAFFMAKRAYVGGRNECFMFGPYRNGPYIDYDLRGAYPTAMAAIRVPDWANARQVRDGEVFPADALAVMRVRFTFPATVRFPVLACDGEGRGLIFPQSGETYAWAPEVAVALNLGATIEILEGYFVPWLDDRRPFATFIQEQTKIRKAAKTAQNTFGEMLAKETVNSAYGKTGQGLKNKSVFDTAKADTREIDPSVITCPFFAGLTTALVRAVLGEILNGLPLHSEVVNVITDGFLTNSTRDEVMAACKGPLATLFAQWRELVAGQPEDIIEVKGETPGICGVRTRLHFSLDGGNSVSEDDDTEDPAEPGNIVANVGVKFDAEDFEGCAGELEIKQRRSELLVDLFANRQPGQTRSMKRLRNARDIYDAPDCDITIDARDQKLNMEFDFKRQIDIISSGLVGGTPHLAFTTKPWATIDEFNAFRDKIDGSAFVLKAAEDLPNLEKLSQHKSHNPSPGKRRPARKQGEGRRALTTRQAQQIAASKAGTPRHLAAKLTAAGIPTDAARIRQHRKDAARRDVKATELPAATSVLDVHHRLANALPDHDGAGLPPDAQVEFKELRLQIAREADTLSSAAGVSVLGMVVPVTASDGSGDVRLLAAFTQKGETQPLEVREVRDFAKQRRDELAGSTDNKSN